MLDNKLIVIDGPDGSGKSSIIELLKSKLNSDLFCFTKDPGGNTACDAIRKLCVEDTHDYSSDTLLLLYLASRTQLNRDIIRPAFQQFKHVICDRYSSSTYAYQGYAENKVQYIHELEQSITGICPIDVFIYLDVDPVIGLERSKKKAKSLGTNELRFENKGPEYYDTIRKGYEIFMDEYLSDDVPILMIDTSMDNCQEFVVHQIIYFLLSVLEDKNIRSEQTTCSETTNEC